MYLDECRRLSRYAGEDTASKAITSYQRLLLPSDSISTVLLVEI